MKSIESQFGPFEQAEINLYMKEVLNDNLGIPVINPFQRRMVFGMFYKYFRDTQSIYAINKKQYVELIIAAKRILRSKNMLVLPYIIAGKVDKLVQRKSVNKKEKLLVESSPTFPLIREKYKDDNITMEILSIIATIISSDFSIVDMDPTIHGQRLDTVATNVIIEEVESYILMC